MSNSLVILRYRDRDWRRYLHGFSRQIERLRSSVSLVTDLRTIVHPFQRHGTNVIADSCINCRPQPPRVNQAKIGREATFPEYRQQATAIEADAENRQQAGFVYIDQRGNGRATNKPEFTCACSKVQFPSVSIAVLRSSRGSVRSSRSNRSTAALSSSGSKKTSELPSALETIGAVICKGFSRHDSSRAIRAGYRRVFCPRTELVAQIEFTEWTPDGHLRHSKFVGLREDKEPKAVIREALDRATSAAL